MMKCPKCGYERQPRDNQYVPATECPACGIVYVKSGPMTGFGSKNPSGPVLSKSSPVDEESLKKARERVEKRLRKQLEARVYDEKHAQTLQRARLLTSQALEQRRVENTREENPVDGLKTVSEDAFQEDVFQMDASQTNDGESVLDLVDIAAQGRQTETSAEDQAEDQPDQMAIEGETDAIREAAVPQDAPLESRKASEENAPEPGEAANQAASESRADEKQTDAPAPEVSHKSEAETTSGEAAQDAPPPTAEPDHKAAAPPLMSSYRHADSYPDQPRRTADSLSRLLPMVAWMILLAGIIGAVLSWTTIKDVQAGLRSASAADTHAMPIGLLLGFAYLATGVLGFAFFWVSSLISRQLSDIRYLLLKLPLPLPQTEQADAPWVDRDDEVEA